MGKREDVKLPRKDRDKYYTIDPVAAKALAPHVMGVRYIEPCYGGGNLVKLLQDHTYAGLVSIGDIDNGVDARVWQYSTANATHFITNPPFKRDVLLPIIDNLSSQLPTWLLLPADMIHNLYMKPYMAKCSHIVSVGRMYWEENKVKGVDNFCWLQLHNAPQTTIFHSRET